MIRRASFLGACFASLSLAAPAIAQEGRARDYSSPQHFAAELRLGLYYPKIDQEFGASGPNGPYDKALADGSIYRKPFRRAFGTKVRLSIGGEFDWQSYRIPHFGTIGPGVQVQYVKFGRPALLESGAASEESTSLQIFPMAALAVLRVDVLARELGVPFVPYLKGGFGLALWRMSNASGTAKITHVGPKGELVTDVTGKGVSYGPQFAIGGMLLLDGLDPYAASQADATTGINHTYLYGEFYTSKLNNIHGTGLQLGTNTASFGLAFEF